MLIVGLTGGIGSGKSTVAALFEAHGVPIIDADQITRRITALNQPALNAIVEHYSKAILKENGELNRSKLRQIIFEDPKERVWLESLLHPLVLAEMQQELKKLNAPYCILVIPLLVEVTPYPFLDRILVVDTTYDNQKKRVLTRDNVVENQIDAIINTQVRREIRLKHAHDVIHNDGTLADLEPQVESLHQKYLKICARS